MGSLFSKKKPVSRVTQQDEAVLQLKTQRDKLKMYQRQLEVKMDKDKLLARQLIKEGKKEKAKSLLTKKRYQEKLIERTLNQLDGVQRMIHDIEFAKIEMEVMDGLKLGNESLKKMHEVLSLEDVENILEDTREAVEYQQEIDALVSGTLSSTDMSDVENELEALLAEDTAKIDAALPDVPDEDLPEREAAREKKKHQEKRIAQEAM